MQKHRHAIDRPIDHRWAGDRCSHRLMAGLFFRQTATECAPHLTYAQFLSYAAQAMTSQRLNVLWAGWTSLCPEELGVWLQRAYICFHRPAYICSQG